MVLSLFSRIFGLRVNAWKSVVIFGGAPVNTGAISRMLGIIEGHFPSIFGLTSDLEVPL